MTKTAIEMEALKSKEQIADKDRALAEKKFKHEKKMDYINAGLKGITSLFTLGKGGAIKQAASKFKHNDAIWYKRYIKDVDKFTNIATYVRNGTTKYGGFNHEKTSTMDNYGTVPGLALFEWVPSINSYNEAGSLGIPSSSINQILMRTKEQVLKSNSRSNVPYEAADLGINFLATGSILTAIAEYEKLILIAQTYRADNSYYAKSYLDAFHASSAWLDDLADARKYLLILKQRFNSALVAPAELTLYQKWLYVATAWIKDQETDPSGVYAFNCTRYFKLNDTGSGLIAIPADKYTPKSFYDQISGMIQVLAENPDYQAMYADLRSAVQNLVQLSEGFDSSATIKETYDKVALEQIANIQTVPQIYTDGFAPSDVDGETLEVHQTDSGYLYQGITPNDLGIKFSVVNEEFNVNPSHAVNQYYGIDNTYLNFHKTTVNGDDVLDATRGIINIKSIGNGEEYYTFRVTSSDVCLFTNIRIIHNRYTNGQLYSTATDVSTHNFLPNIDAGQEFLTVLSVAQAFDWMPILNYIQCTDSSMSCKSIGDIHKLVPVDRETIENINQVCLLSLFYIDSNTFKR